MHHKVRKLIQNLSWQYHVNDLSIKLNRTNALLFEMTKYVSLVVKALDSQSRGPVFKTAGWLQGRLSLSSSRGR